MLSLVPGIRADLLATIQRLRSERPAERVEAMLRAWQDRFPPERLAALSGAELLHEMHGRGGDSLAYWLEHKNDNQMACRWFGSIAGGSALKFVVFQSSDNNWYSGHPKDVQQVSLSQAAAVAEAQRNQLLAALQVVQALPLDSTNAAWDGLREKMAKAAPDFHHLAFFHKAISMWASNRIDDFHSVPHQAGALVWSGLPVHEGGLWDNARTFCELRRVLEQESGEPTPMTWVSHAMWLRSGEPAAVWRIGAGTDEYDAWPYMEGRDVVAIGWTELGDLAELLGEESGHGAMRALRLAIQAQWPVTTPQQAGREAHQIYRFVRKMRAEDIVVVARGMNILGVGRVKGDYQFVPGAPYANQRRVEWLSRQPWQTPSRTGLLTTVFDLTEAYDYRMQIAHHLARGIQAPAAIAVRPLSPTVASMLAQLERKGQILVYGPPGTGKTFHAMQAAEELAAAGAHGRTWAALRGEERAALKATGTGQRIWTCTFHPAYGYEDFVEGLFPRPTESGLAFEPRPGLFRSICQSAEQYPDETFVLVIDEFNRGDAARIFGELLTLLELDKRGRIHVVLPHSRSAFTVPQNVRVIATMNTSDRSIALLDAALQRRFGKIELLPEPAILGDAAVDDISLAGLLTAINRRLLDVLGDRARDLQVGHAYFMRDGRPLATRSSLRDVVRHDLLPLLQDYCGDDPRQLQRLVGDQLFDVQARRFHRERLSDGQEELLTEALLGWGEEVRAVAFASEDEPEIDEQDES